MTVKRRSRVMVRSGRKFAYYNNLPASQRRIYDRSDAIEHVRLPQPEHFSSITDDLRSSLEGDDLAQTKQSAEHLIRDLCQAFCVPPMKVRVLSRRPTRNRVEMHGLYEAGKGKATVLTVWMRTAKRKQTVAFRTFLRTIVHEFIHHLDFTYFNLRNSFHTEGFFKRESSLVKQLLNDQRR